MTLTLESVETPAGVVDRSAMIANATRVAGYCAKHGIAWRPHVKTHKSTRVARIQLAAGAAGLTVATPHEAEVMSAVCNDLLLAYPPVGREKLARLMALPAEVDLTVALDSTAVLRPLADAAVAADRTVGVLVELDVGMGRVGVQGVDAAVRLAAAVAESEGVEYRGVAFYAGHLRGAGSANDEGIDELSRHLGEIREALTRAGYPPTVVSGGTTPTIWRSHEVDGLTEMRAGTCIFFDRDGIAMEIADPGDLAYTVLATVVSTAVEGQAVIDAGSKALSKESRGGAGGFGILLDRPEVRVVRLSEEHGILDLSDTSWRPSVGSRVRVVPNHVCVSVNLQDRLLVVDGTAVEAWPLEGRGRLGGKG